MIAAAIVIQLALAAFGLAALWMSMGTNPRARRWAPVVGLCGQPFWLTFAVFHNAWGLLALSIAYSGVYLRGIWVQWRQAHPPTTRHRCAWFNE